MSRPRSPVLGDDLDETDDVVVHFNQVLGRDPVLKNVATAYPLNLIPIEEFRSTANVVT